MGEFVLRMHSAPFFVREVRNNGRVVFGDCGDAPLFTVAQIDAAMKRAPSFANHIRIIGAFDYCHYCGATDGDAFDCAECAENPRAVVRTIPAPWLDDHVQRANYLAGRAIPLHVQRWAADEAEKEFDSDCCTIANGAIYGDAENGYFVPAVVWIAPPDSPNEDDDDAEGNDETQ